MRLRKLVVFDRLMARLLVVAKDRWVLKGAVALEVRLGARFRTTKDMDLARQDSEQAATTDFLAAQSVDLGDYFTLAIQRTKKLDAALEGAAVRYHVYAELAGRPFEDVIVDVGFSDPLVSHPDLLRGPDLLSFAGINPIEVPVLPLEQHVAEKVHAYTRSYAGGHLSSRVKDLIDLVLILSNSAFHAGCLRRALHATSDTRGTHTLPTTLPSPPPHWGPAYRKMATEVGLNPDISVGYGQVAAFLDPILGGTVPDSAHWDSTRRTW
ncbi:MAG: nucleotidyl transferase AbiEii/AbiGii toxin family protein [Chloroflexota bacterium]